MKTRILASCALAVFSFCTQVSALDIRLGGNVAFMAGEGDSLTTAAGAVVATTGELAFKNSADVTVKADYLTTTLDYGAYINLDLDPNAGSGNVVEDVDAHIRVRFSRGTFKLGTDIDGLQGAEDLDWITKGPISLGNSVSAPSNAGYSFTHSAQEATTIAADGSDAVTSVGESSITFTSNNYSGFTLAAEATPNGGNGDIDWGASVKYVGKPYRGYKVTAVAATDSSKAVMGNAKVEFGDLAINGFVGEDDDKEHYEGGAISYDLGKISLSGGYIAKEAELLAEGTAGQRMKQNDIVLGAAYTLAPGLVIDGSYSIQEHITVGASPAAAVKVDADRYLGRVKLTF